MSLPQNLVFGYVSLVLVAKTTEERGLELQSNRKLQGSLQGIISLECHYLGTKTADKNILL
jgi:hypothetical protein